MNNYCFSTFKYLSYQILSTPTKAYNLRSRLVPLSSPDHLNGMDDNVDDIWAEQPPSDMTEMALTEELRQVQVQQYGASLMYLNAYKVIYHTVFLYFLLRSKLVVSRHSWVRRR